MEPSAPISEIKDASATSSGMHCSSSSLPYEADDLHKGGADATLTSDENPTSEDNVREEGLRAFRAGDWRGATDAWSRGLRTLEYILAREEEFDEDKKKEFLAMHQSYLLNLSLSTLKEGRWAACILYCDKVLQRDPTAVKALYRKAQSQQELGDFDGALATLDRYLTVSPGSPLALSLQAQLRRLKAAHAVKEKKLLQGVFRMLEHDPRSEAAESPAAEAAAAEKKGLTNSVKDWLRGFTSKKQSTTDWQQHSRNMVQDIAAVQAAMRASGMDSNTYNNFSEEAVAEAVTALLESKGKAGSADVAELKKITAFLNKYQAMNAGRASFMDKLRFRLALMWFGIQHICESLGCSMCRRRQTRQKEQAEPEWEDVQSTSSAASRRQASEGKESRCGLNRAQRRQSHRAATAAAARRRRQQQQDFKEMTPSSKIEDLDALGSRHC